MSRYRRRLCAAVTAAHLLATCIAVESTHAVDGPNLVAPREVAAGKWFDSLFAPQRPVAEKSVNLQRRHRRRMQRSIKIQGKLLNNPDTSDGSPPYVIVDSYGGVLRYVEPVDNIDLESHIGQNVVVRRDVGHTLLASQLALPKVRATDGVQLAQYEEPNIVVGRPGSAYLDDGLDFGEYPSCGVNDCGRFVGCGDGVLGCGDGCRPGPRWLIFADYLLWQSRSTEVAYAVPLLDGVPIGQTAVADVDYNSGFRVGLERPLNPCSWLSVGYTYFSGNDSSSLEIDPKDGEVFSLVSHPATFDSKIVGYDAFGSLDIELQMLDVQYRRALFRTPVCSTGCGACVAACGPVRLNCVGGFRYASFDQDFRSWQTLFDDKLDSLDRHVAASLEFRGAGPKLGFEVETSSCHSPFFTYARTYASFLAGSYEGHYVQLDQDDEKKTVVEYFNTWKKDRLAPVLDMEIGLGFFGPPGTCLCNSRFSVGYVASYWLNAVTTDAFIEASQFLDYVELGDTISFDGLAVRAEILF